MNPMDALATSFTTGLPYEFVGIVYYVFFVLMSRGRNVARFSPRSRRDFL